MRIHNMRAWPCPALLPLLLLCLHSAVQHTYAQPAVSWRPQTAAAADSTKACPITRDQAEKTVNITMAAKDCNITGIAKCGKTHTVTTGDTCFAIGQQYGVSVDDLITSLNPGLTCNKLSPGQEICISAAINVGDTFCYNCVCALRAAFIAGLDKSNASFSGVPVREFANTPDVEILERQVLENCAGPLGAFVVSSGAIDQDSLAALARCQVDKGIALCGRAARNDTANTSTPAGSETGGSSQSSVPDRTNSTTTAEGGEDSGGSAGVSADMSNEQMSNTTAAPANSTSSVPAYQAASASDGGISSGQAVRYSAGPNSTSGMTNSGACHCMLKDWLVQWITAAAAIFCLLLMY